MKCHICSSDYQQTDKKRLVFRCSECGHLHRQFTGDNIQYHRDIYRTQKAHQRVKGEFNAKGAVTNAFHAARKKICEQRMTKIDSYLSSDMKCLDVGAGAGTFANLLSKKVKSVDCTELSAPLIHECQRFGFRVYTKDFLGLSDNWGQYDIVFAWHVLEHVEDAHGFVSKMAQFTQRYVILEVPCKRKIRDQYDGHVHHFCRKSLKTLFSKCDLNLVAMTDGIQAPAILAIGEK